MRGVESSMVDKVDSWLIEILLLSWSAYGIKKMERQERMFAIKSKGPLMRYGVGSITARPGRL